MSKGNKKICIPVFDWKKVPKSMDLSSFHYSTPKSVWEPIIIKVFNLWLMSFLQTMDEKPYEVLLSVLNSKYLLKEIDDWTNVSSLVFSFLLDQDEVVEKEKTQEMIHFVINLQIIIEVMMGRVLQYDCVAFCKSEIILSIEIYLMDLKFDSGDLDLENALENALNPLFETWEEFYLRSTKEVDCCGHSYIIAKNQSDFSDNNTTSCKACGEDFYEIDCCNENYTFGKNLDADTISTCCKHCFKNLYDPDEDDDEQERPSKKRKINDENRRVKRTFLLTELLGCVLYCWRPCREYFRTDLL